VAAGIAAVSARTSATVAVPALPACGIAQASTSTVAQILSQAPGPDRRAVPLGGYIPIPPPVS
jgi:hypothetical protein